MLNFIYFKKISSVKTLKSNQLGVKRKKSNWILSWTSQTLRTITIVE